jgi:hypothetical protein
MSRRRGGAFNVISVSAIDLFASAMGVFIVLAIIMVPFFLNKDRVLGAIREMRAQIAELTGQLDNANAANVRLQGDLDAANAANGRLQGELDQTNADNADLQGQIDDVRSELSGAKPNVVVAIAWETNPNDDIDLHVLDPLGNHVYYAERQGLGGSELTVDSLNAGAEVFADPSPDDGEYVICYHYFSAASGSSRRELVEAFLFYNDKIVLPTFELSRVTQKVEIARLVVEGREGRVVTDRHGQACPYEIKDG